jgi:hypothetical protein
VQQPELGDARVALTAMARFETLRADASGVLLPERPAYIVGAVAVVLHELLQARLGDPQGHPSSGGPHSGNGALNV